jgi:hypothetical protein
VSSAVHRGRPAFESLFRAARRRGRAIAVLSSASVVGSVALVGLHPAGAAGLPLVPAGDMAYLKEAAASCPALTPARLAGQIMGPRPAQTDVAVIAAVTTDSWDAWAPYPGASPADHRAKILALAHETCDLVGQLRVAKVPGDPWRSAVAAGQAGIAAVKAAHGVPASALPYVRTVSAAADHYAQQKQFGGPGPKPAPKPAPTAATPAATPTSTGGSKTPLAAATPAATPSTGKTTGGTQAPTDPPARTGREVAYDPTAKYQITNPFTDTVLELPGDDDNTRTGTPVQVWKNLGAADQHWQLEAVGADGSYYQILNASSGKAMAVRDGSTEDFAGVDQVRPDAGDKAQQWLLRPAGDGTVWIVNRLSGKALDLIGDDLPAENGKQVDLWSLQTYAKDQRWKITK